MTFKHAQHSTAQHRAASYLILPKRHHETSCYYLHFIGQDTEPWPSQAKEPGLLNSKSSPVPFRADKIPREETVDINSFFFVFNNLF